MMIAGGGGWWWTCRGSYDGGEQSCICIRRSFCSCFLVVDQSIYSCWTTSFFLDDGRRSLVGRRKVVSSCRFVVMMIEEKREKIKVKFC